MAALNFPSSPTLNQVYQANGKSYIYDGVSWVNNTRPGIIFSGTVTLDFGAFPGSNEASVTFADTKVTTGTNIIPYFAGNDTSTNYTANDHKYASIFIGLTAAANNGVGGIIYARSAEKMQGQWTARYTYTI